MKLIQKAREMGRRFMEAISEDEIEKRNGVFVGRYLEPANAKKWHDWAVKHGVPNPVPPEEMHVTVIYSITDAKLARDERGMTIYTGPGYGTAGSFCMFGPENEALVFAFANWDLYNRHWEFLSNGAKTTWPEYRPHLTISQDAKGFELSDEALSEVPTYIVLMSEQNADLKQPTKDEANQDGPEDAEEGDDVLIIVVEMAKTKAAQMIEAEKEKATLSFFDQYALADVARGTISKGLARRLAAETWAPEEFKALAEGAAVEKKRVDVDTEIKVQSIEKALGKKGKEVFKSIDEERRLVWGIASVSTVKGKLVEDHHEEGITTRALEEFSISLAKGRRGGKFDHEGEIVNEVVQNFVLSDEVQKALGIDLGYEALLVTIEVREQDWPMVRDGDWELSIAGRMSYYE